MKFINWFFIIQKIIQIANFYSPHGDKSEGGIKMKKQINVWIYCRISEPDNIEVLNLQANRLSKYAKKNNYSIIGLTKVVDDGTSLHTLSIKPLLTAIKEDVIDLVLIYSNRRLLVSNDLFEEFEILCELHDVKIIALQHE